MRRDLIILAVLAAATAAVYAPVLHFDFTNYDDDLYVTANPHVLGGLTRDGVAWAFTATHASNWHPLTWLAHMLDVELFGLWAGGHHLSSVLLHVLNTALVYLALKRLTAARVACPEPARPLAGGRLPGHGPALHENMPTQTAAWACHPAAWACHPADRVFHPAAAVAALFALHPLHVESVAWVSERKDVLSTFFWMLTLLAYARYAARPGVWRYLAVAACVALGLAAKPMLVTLPLVLLLIDWWPLGRLMWPSRPRLGIDHDHTRERVCHIDHTRGRVCHIDHIRGRVCHIGTLLLEKVPLLAMAVASAVMTIIAQGRGGAIMPTSVQSLGHRLANAVIAYASYLRLMVWPEGLCVTYPPRLEIPAWQWIVSLAVLAVISGLVVWQARRRPYLLFGWLWYLGTLVPVIGLVQVGEQAMADRYTYVPLVGIFIMLAWGAAEVAGTRRAVIIAVAGTAALAGCIVVTARQVQTWRNSITLFERAVAATTGGALAHGNLGNALFEAGRFDDAVPHYREALRLREPTPWRAAIHNNLANTYVRLGRFREAIPEYKRALEILPNYGLFRDNLEAVLRLRADQAGEPKARPGPAPGP